ncbi:hypothetical protein [Roseibium sp. M-1]
MVIDQDSDWNMDQEAAAGDEEALNRRLILTPAGEDWSGRTRYAAAMYFYQNGRMSAEVLEIYRILSRQDEVDPVDVLIRHRMGEDWQATLKEFQEMI